jgi:hypothetical protein
MHKISDPSFETGHLKEINMKLKTTLLAAILSAFALSSFSAFAAEDKSVEPSAEVKPAKTVTKKKVKPHSHAQEKTGTPSAAPDTTTDEPKKPLHDHSKVHKQQ